jgi:hypothetical protein
MSRGIEKLNVRDKKAKQEAEFQAWANKNTLPEEGYINALALIEQSQTEAKEENATLQYISETFFQSVELVQTMLGRFNPEQFYKDYDEATDRDVAKRMFQIYRENNKRLPSIYEKIDAEFGGNSDAYVDWLYDNSQLTSLEKFNAIAALDAEAREAAFNNDPVYELAKSIFELYRELAPAVMGQFGEGVTPAIIKGALMDIGFKEVHEVASGADVAAATEAHQYVDEVVSGKLPFLLTSCCPSWAMLAKKQFPTLIDKVSQSLTPMVATARRIKQRNPNARVVFIGPCAAKKLEASRASVRSDVDFVITFEELAGIFDAKNVDFSKYQGERSIHEATGAGRGYAVAGGVASAIEKCVKEYYPGVEVKIEHAEGLDECKKMLLLAKAGKKNGCLIEGMGCPGGCIAGAGTNISVEKAQKEVQKFVENSTKRLPPKDLYEIELP